jgi:tetratricopeptide (TPR) repeat protein
MLKRLGAFLAETGDFSGAAALYEKAMAAREGEKEPAPDVLLRMEMGRLYHLLQKHDKAAGQFARVLDALERPGDITLEDRVRKAVLGERGSTYNLIGESFLLADQPEKAAAAFEKAHDAAPNKGLLAYQLARIDFRTGKSEKALDKLNACFRERLASEGLGPCRLLADALKALGREKELVPLLESFRAADPANVPLGHFLAEQHRQAGQFEKAEPLYRDLLAKAPTIAGYRGLIEIYRKTNRHDALLPVLGDAVEKTATLEPLAEKGRGLADDAPLVQSLVALARARVKSGPDRLPYPQRLAVALLALDAGQWVAAGEFFDLALQARPEQAQELLLTWGLGLLMKEQYDRAAAVLRRGTDPKTVRENNREFFYYLAGALEAKGKSDEALDAARKAVPLAHAHDMAQLRKAATSKKREVVRREEPRYLSRVAWVYYHAKRHDEAVKAYAEVIAKYGNDYSSSENRQVIREAKLVLSNLAVIKGDMPQAIEWLQQVLDEFPDDASALNDLGYLWADEGTRLERAHRMIQQALAKEPDNAAYRDSLGWVLFRLGRTAEALAELEKAAAKEPDPAVLDHLGDAYRAAGKADKARDAWRRSIDAYKKAGEPDKVRHVEKKLAPT